MKLTTAESKNITTEYKNQGKLYDYDNYWDNKLPGEYIQTVELRNNYRFPDPREKHAILAHYICDKIHVENITNLEKHYLMFRKINCAKNQTLLANYMALLNDVDVCEEDIETLCKKMAESGIIIDENLFGYCYTDFAIYDVDNTIKFADKVNKWNSLSFFHKADLSRRNRKVINRDSCNLICRSDGVLTVRKKSLDFNND